MKALISLLFSFSLETQILETQKLSILQNSKKISHLKKDLRKLREEKELSRACELEEELKKIPKACSQLEKMNKKDIVSHHELVQRLCKHAIKKSNSLKDLKRWKKIPSLNSHCKNLLTAKIERLIYQKENIDYDRERN